MYSQSLGFAKILFLSFFSFVPSIFSSLFNKVVLNVRVAPEFGPVINEDDVRERNDPPLALKWISLLDGDTTFVLLFSLLSLSLIFLMCR